MSKSTHTHLMNSKARTTLNQRAIRIKNARLTISGRHSQQSAHGAPPMNTSPSERWQVSSPYAGSASRVKDSDGTISNDKTSEYPLMLQPMLSGPIDRKQQQSEVQVCESFIFLPVVVCQEHPSNYSV
jgi:hypothetical protein